MYAASDCRGSDICSLTCSLPTKDAGTRHGPRVACSAGDDKRERIQSESSALGADGQDLLHRVERHGRRLVGKAMTDGLRRRGGKKEERVIINFTFHSMFGKQKEAQMDVESVMKRKCKAKELHGLEETKGEEQTLLLCTVTLFCVIGDIWLR